MINSSPQCVTDHPFPSQMSFETCQLHSPSEALEGETAGLLVPAFVGLCTGDAGVDFTGDPGSSVAVSFSPGK